LQLNLFLVIVQITNLSSNFAHVYKSSNSLHYEFCMQSWIYYKLLYWLKGVFAPFHYLAVWHILTYQWIMPNMVVRCNIDSCMHFHGPIIFHN
jgi:hypothetical protein